MRSHVLVYLAPVPFLVVGEPMPPSAVQPRADARTLARTAAHLAIHTAAATPKPSLFFPVAYRYDGPRGTPTATAAPVSDEELKPAILTLRDVTFSQMTEGDIQVEAEAIAKALATIDP